MQTAAIVVAAGRGTRAQDPADPDRRPKQWRALAGRRVLDHTLDALRAAGIGRLVVVLHPDDTTLHGAAIAATPDTRVVAGGDSRDASVRAGLEALEHDGTTHVLIHDGARPLLSGDLVARLLVALRDAPAAAPAVAVTDALWRGAAGRVVAAVPRDGLWRAQTPQAFRLPAILAAHRAHRGPAADDVEIARAAGLDVIIVPGDEDNLKLTWPEDFARAERILAARAAAEQRAHRMDIRTGNGFDVHRFGPGDHVWLCGVRLAHPRGLLGHSDADVGLHALTDAIYGALAEGDIGTHFPPSDPQWKGAASHIFLRHAAALAATRGFRLTHCDVTLICEAPKIGPHAAAMRATLSGILGIDQARISVKATTTERLGFTGREEGIAALATATLVLS